MNRLPQKTRELVYDRDDYRCVCCGTPIEGRPHSVAHRKRRSQGGRHVLSNLLTFLGCGSNPGDPDDHHARIDSRRNPGDEEKGYTCRSWQDPATVSVTYWTGTQVWLSDDDGMSYEAPAGAA